MDKHLSFNDRVNFVKQNYLIVNIQPTIKLILYLFSEELIEKNMLKMKDWLKAYEERKRNAQLKEERSAEKKRLTEEKLYDHFGYQISVNTTKAKDYLRDLAEQEKKERKLQYKQDKQERERAQLKELLHKEAEAEKEKETK